MLRRQGALPLKPWTLAAYIAAGGALTPACPAFCQFAFRQVSISAEGMTLFVRRTDAQLGWGQDLQVQYYLGKRLCRLCVFFGAGFSVRAKPLRPETLQPVPPFSHPDVTRGSLTPKHDEL